MSTGAIRKGAIYSLGFMASSSAKAVGCVYCNAAPTPHLILWLETAISLYFDRPMRVVFKPLVIVLTPLVRWLTNTLLHFLFSLFALIGLVTFHDEYQPDHVDRKSVMFAEAKKRGIRMQIIRFRGRELSYTRAKLPFSQHWRFLIWHYFEYIPFPPWKDSPLWQNLDNKLELKRLFEKGGIRVPRGKALSSESDAVKLFRELGVPVIVKPLEGSRSRHTRVNITDETELRDAFKKALQVCPMAVVEEFIPGSIYRATCVGGRLIGVMELVRPLMRADGNTSVDELRVAYNDKTSLAGVKPIEPDALFALTCEHQGFNADSIPAEGTEVLLAEFSERTSGGYFIDLTDSVPAESVSYIEKAAQVSGLPVVGFDVITRDISNAMEPITFLEANTAPFIEIHHIPYAGKIRNVAGPIWDLWNA